MSSPPPSDPDVDKLAPAPLDESPPPAPALESGDVAVAHVIETVQTVLTALILAFAFRAFWIEAFIIPTGSMAPGLLGAHVTLVCPSCGLEYDVGPDRFETRADLSIDPPRSGTCPNCHTRTDIDPAVAPVKAGDRILVHKWPYLLGGWLGPDRWDVIVFRDPADPSLNYIKRLVGLPGESVEIIDGDVYINGRIARKTAAAQSVLWMLVFDQNHVAPDDGRGGHRGSIWRPAGDAAAGWQGLETRVVRYRPAGGERGELTIDGPTAEQYLQDFASFNHGGSGTPVGDLRLRADVTFEDAAGEFEIVLDRDGTVFRASVSAAGVARVTMSTAAGETTEVGGVRTRPAGRGERLSIEFAHVDYRVYLRVRGEQVAATTDASYAPHLAALRHFRRVQPVGLRLAAGGGPLLLRNLRLERDVHYTYRASDTRRAFAGEPFTLLAGEYFVLGDNSARSHDSREWFRVGPHLQADWEADRYRLGTVRADQIVGRAFFVYLPGLLPLDERGRWRLPDLGRVRFIR